MNYMKKFLHQISKHTLMTTMLTFALVMSPAGVTLAAETPNSKSVSKTVSEQAGKENNTIDPAFDIAHGWDVLEYTDDMDIPVTSTFLEGRKTQMPNGDQYNTAYINFANIGNSLFKAQRVFNLEKGKTYNFTWYYQAHVLGGSQASISFNGDVKTATPIDTNNMDDLLPKPYKKTIVAKEDQDYTVTLEYNAPKYSNVLMSVGYKIGDPNHGVDIEEEAPVQKEKGKVIVQYVDQAGKSIKASTEISGDVGDRYTVKVPRIPGYLLQETSDNVMGTFQSSSQTVTLTYEKIPAVENGKVVVNFVDENGKALTDSPEILTGEVGSSYAAKPKSFPGYRLKKLPDNQAGKFSNQPEEVTFTYEKIPAVENGKVVVNFLDENGKALTDSPEILTGEVGSSYAAKPKSFPGYQLKKLPDNQAGKFSNQPEEVTFTYEKIPAVENGKVVVNFVDENGKALTDSPEILTGEVGSSYAAKPKSFPGYQLKKLPDNQAGKFSNQPEEVTFTYEKIPAVENGKVVVNFVDESGKALTDSPEILTGEVGSSYAAKPKSFPGYQLKKLPDNQAGKFSNKTEEVTFIYREIKTSGQGSGHSSNEPPTGSNSGKEENANNENGQVPNSEKPAVPSNGENGSHSNHANSEQAGSSIIDSGAVTIPVKKEWVPQMKASNQPAVPLASDISSAKKTFNAKNLGQNRSNQLEKNTELPVTGDNSPVASGLLGLMLILGSICRLKK
ncbi:MucBP domain-containing protein [Listeria aquatica]|uniref:MucBP domain-containing protein n=1 Tax=Listeria aquatica TaxID=1494960 RepID=UPI003F7068C3